MRYIYVDEAGTSEREPITVILALIVKADAHLRLATERLAKVLSDVPAQFQDRFIFHATAVMNDPKYRDGWSLSERLALFKAVLRIPGECGMGLVIGTARRDGPSHPEELGLPFRKSEWDHFMAFVEVMVFSDAYVHVEGGEDETATVVAEDLPEMRKHLKMALQVARTRGPTYHLQHQTPPTGPIAIRATGGTMDAIQDTILFAEKADAPFLQIVDACAYAFRRWLTEQKGGAELVEECLGHLPDIEFVRGSPSVTAAFHPKPKPSGTI